MFNVFHEEKETDYYSVICILTSGYKLQMGLFIISFCSCFWEKFLLCRPNLASKSLWPKLAWPGTHEPSMPAYKGLGWQTCTTYLPKEGLKA